jgi:V/A-type H+-transporting ATPase subunit D
MREASPTRAALLELQDERRALHEGHVFLDEKCLLLAGEMLRQLQQHARLERQLGQAHEAAMDALRAALGRHGLQGLQVLPPREDPGTRLGISASSLMGVPLQQAQWTPGPPAPEPPSIAPSPELRACRRAFAAYAAAAAPLAAVNGNLERLSQEYRRSVRRARALQDVMLPELERDIAGIETGLEELEQQDALAMRRPVA